MEPTTPLIELILEFLLELFKIILPFLSGIIIFYLTSSKEDKINKNSVLKERLNNLYIPFYQLFCRYLLFKLPPNSLSNKSLLEFLKLFSENVHLMGSFSQYHYPDFYEALLNMYEVNDGSKDYSAELVKTKFNDAFKEMSQALFKEYSDICSKLKLQKPVIKFF